MYIEKKEFLTPVSCSYLRTYVVHELTSRLSYGSIHRSSVSAGCSIVFLLLKEI
jgi:hypothetical protein